MPLTWFSRSQSRRPKRSPQRYARARLAVETLENRVLCSVTGPGQVVMASVQAVGPIGLRFTYSVHQSPAAPFDVAIYRSPTASFDPKTAVEVAEASVSGPRALAEGNHTVAISVGSGHLIQNLARDWLQPDAVNPYILAVADPSNLTGQTAGAHDTASFRVYVLGAVVPGFGELDPRVPPQWVQTMANSLQSPQSGAGFSQVIPFGWNSTDPDPTLVIQAGIRLANEIKRDSKALSATLKPNDVIDVTFIGHSRGSVVISLAMERLAKGVIPQLAHGYKELLLIDPHPANRAYGDNASFNILDPLSDLVFAAYWYVEKEVHDPQIAVPPDVSYAKEWWQHSLFSAFPAGTEEHELNLWGLDPGSVHIDKPAATLFENQPLTDALYNGAPIGHSETTDWFQANVIPQLLAPGY